MQQANNHIQIYVDVCMYTVDDNISFLNQVCTGRRMLHAWFLEIALVHASVCVHARVCVCPQGH